MPHGEGSTITQKGLIWARGKLGQKVGRGECWDLADRALRHAGGHIRMKDPSGHIRMAKVIKTVAITVTGTVWAYRPKAATQ